MLPRSIFARELARRTWTSLLLPRGFAVSACDRDKRSDADKAVMATPSVVSEKELFAPENIRGLSPVEVARMRVVYGFVKEHADAVGMKACPVELSSNPLIDPRSVRFLWFLFWFLFTSYAAPLLFRFLPYNWY
jgi:hypothetical protein